MPKYKVGDSIIITRDNRTSLITFTAIIEKSYYYTVVNLLNKNTFSRDCNIDRIDNGNYESH